MAVAQSTLPERPSGTFKYYVYALCYPSGEPFYVGCGGRGRRLREHEQLARGNGHLPQHEVIREIWKRGEKVRHCIFFESDVQKAALAEEFDQICKHRTSGLLCNIGTESSDRARREREALEDHAPEAVEHRRYAVARQHFALETEILVNHMVERLLAATVEADMRAVAAMPIQKAKKPSRAA